MEREARQKLHNESENLKMILSQVCIINLNCRVRNAVFLNMNELYIYKIVVISQYQTEMEKMKKELTRQSQNVQTRQFS